MMYIDEKLPNPNYSHEHAYGIKHLTINMTCFFLMFLSFVTIMPCTFPITHTFHVNVKMNDFNKQIWGMKTYLSMTKMCYMLAIHKQESVFQIMVKSVYITFRRYPEN